MTTSKLAESAGITPRQLQRLAASGAVPGVIRKPSGRWIVDDEKAALKWAKGFQRWGGKPVGTRKKNTLPPVPSTLSSVASTAEALRRQRKAVAVARKAVSDAMAESVRLGVLLIEDAKRLRGRRWREYLAALGMTTSESAAVMTIARTGGRLEAPTLKTLKVIPARAGSGLPKSGKLPGTGWVRQVGAVIGHFNQAQRIRPLHRWTEDERDGIAAQLEPLAKLYKQLAI